ncbi:MAG TPA: rod shape-determining protein MreC [Bdellovibrionota bacterium]|jgi:rod shape-determining protein MreC|nr:rod shape-determining protein MreC [Bdellovibrionota bacterium]
MILTNFFKRNKRVIAVISLFLVPILPLFLFRTELPRFHLLDKVDAYIVHPIAKLFKGTQGGVDHVWGGYINLVNAAEQNEILQRENQELKSQIISSKEIETENARLRELISMPAPETFQKVIASVIGQDTSVERAGFFINVGSNQGIRERLPVISPQGIVGTVMRVYPDSSLFVAVDDATHVVDGVVARSRSRVMVEGAGAPLTAELKYLDRAEDVRVGDDVFTSGIDGVFPKGLLIGTVISVSRPIAGVLQKSEIRASVDLGKLEEVVVLLPGTSRIPASAMTPEAAAR